MEQDSHPRIHFYSRQLQYGINHGELGESNAIWDHWIRRFLVDAFRRTGHNAPLSDEKHEEHLTCFDGLDVDVFLEVRPGSVDVVTLIDTYMKKFYEHPSV